MSRTKRVLLLGLASIAIAFAASAHAQTGDGSRSRGTNGDVQTYGSGETAPLPEAESRPGVGYQPHGVSDDNRSVGGQSIREVREAKDGVDLDDGQDHSEDEWVQQEPKKAP